jgi:hypothetical protein
MNRARLAFAIWPEKCKKRKNDHPRVAERNAKDVEHKPAGSVSRIKLHLVGSGSVFPRQFVEFAERVRS